MAADDVDRALGASYELVEKLGRGATGEVWRGVDRRTGETIAAKILRHEHVEDDELVERFLRERSILVGLRHENVVAVRDLVVEGDRLAIVMEYVDGGSLRDVVRDGAPLPPALALGASSAVLDGLAAAHERRVLHRDVKPDNVLLTTGWRELAPGAVKLSDFGIARIVADQANASTGLVGTPEYMAPEQLLTGAGDFPADVYGAGILLYELLAGRSPFAGEGTGYTIAHRHVTSQPPRLPVPDPVWDVLASLIDKDPGRRPTARDAATQLRLLRSEAADLAALSTQEAPAEWASAGGAATEVRGLTVPETTDESPEKSSGRDKTPDTEVAPLPDLGNPGQATMLRAMPALPVAPPDTSEEQPERKPPFWRRKRVLASIIAGVLLVGGGTFWLIWSQVGRPNDGPTVTPAIRAQQQSPARPTGLVISRSAVWNPDTQTAQLTLVYAAQRAALTGPFLQSIGAADKAGVCPEVEWQPGAASLNRPSTTGVQLRCGWSVEPNPVPAQQSVSVTATVPLPLPGADPSTALQSWLESMARETEAATTDSKVITTAYAAQRLSDIQVVAPSRTVGGQTLRLSLVPIWPSGSDALNPLFQSPPTGEPSTVLVAVAGGEAGVRFSDGCSGALSVSRDGLVVTAVSLADQCQVNARVGNFIDLASNAFSISTRGS